MWSWGFSFNAALKKIYKKSEVETEDSPEEQIQPGPNLDITTLLFQLHHRTDAVLNIHIAVDEL